MPFAPQPEAFAVTVADTAVVGEGISEGNGAALKYKGVNSMVGTLISWNGKNGGYNLHSTAHMSSVWVIDNKGEMVNGANTDRCPPINFYSKKNDTLSAIKLIAANNATPDKGRTVERNPGLYAGEEFDNIETGTFNGQQNVKYFTVGGEGADDSQISEDWAKAIFAASLYSNSGILNNKDFGGDKAAGEYPTNWVSEYQAITEKIGTNAKYITGFGTPFNEKLEENNKAGNYNYIAIKLESDWTATDVSKISDKEKNADLEPVGAKGHIGRLSNGVNDNNPNGDTLIPLGTTFDANYNQHIMEDIDTGDVYLKSVYKDGTIDTANSAESRPLSERIKNYATSYNEEVRTQQLTFCPAGEGYSFGRLAIPDNAYVILDLNGHKIDRNLTNNAANVDTIVQSVFILGQYARLEVFDSSVSDDHPFGTGEVTGGVTRNATGKVFDNQKWDNYGSDSNYANAVKGGGFTLRNRAELTVHSGSVTNNQGLFGGAFYGVGASTVNVFDARVEGNSAVRGGMCYLSQGSFMTLNMFGGLVQGNSARMGGFAKTNSHGQARQPSVTDPNEMTDEGVYDEQYQKNPDGYGHEGGGICVYQESYCNIYGGTIAYNYSAMFGGGISVSYNSFLKLFGGEITGNVAKGLIRNIQGATIVSESNPKETETPKANVGGAGINMYQDSAGIYLNGPAKVMGNYCSQVAPQDYTTEAIAALIEKDGEKQDSNLYLSLTTSMSRYSWNSDSKKYEESKDRYHLTGDWDLEYGPTFKTGGTVATENQAVSRKGQMQFNPKQHLYPEIKVQGPLYRDANHVAQVSITPAAGIEAGGYIMRQFYPQGWEDDSKKQDTTFNGKDGPRPLKSGAGGSINESSHAKDQIGEDGTTAFNLRSYLKTGATSGYVDGFLFTDGGTSIVAGTGDDEGWYMALGTKQAGNLPVQWQYYDRTVDSHTDRPKGWLNATTTAETGTGFTLVYNGTDRRYDIRVFVDRTKLTVDGTGDTSGYFYLYYDYYTLANEKGEETEHEPDGTPVKHYLYENNTDRDNDKYTNILHITSGYDGSDMEIVQKDGVIYASERYDRLGYRFTIRPDAKNLVGKGDSTAKPFNEKDDFQANPNYATMKIERATLMVSQLTLSDVERYYDGTTDFYVPSSKISQGNLTGYAPADETHLRIEFSGQSDGYVKGTLQSPNVGSNTVSLGVTIQEIGFGEEGSHVHHTSETFPDECLLANYMLFDLNTATTYPAEDRGEMSVTLNVTVKPKPIRVELEKQSYEYGSVPIFDNNWGTHANSANWAETYGKTSGGAESDALKALFSPDEKVPPLGQEGFDPNKLGMDGKLAQVDINNENVDPDHGTVDKNNLALRLDQILRISFNSSYMDRSPVNTYGGSFSYTNNNYNVTWRFNGVDVPGMSGGNLTPAQINDLIEITKRKINATVSNAASIYGETQATLTLLNENIKHINAEGKPLEGDNGVGLVFGDTLNATLGLTDAKFVATASNILRATMSADGKSPIIGEGYYTIAITNLDKINSNYELIAENVTAGKYTVYPRKIVLTANPYTSVYGDPVAAGMGGFEYTLAESQKNDLDVTSTVIFPTDLNAFNKGISYAYSDGNTPKNKGDDYKFNVKFDHTKATEGDEDIGINYDVSYGADATHIIEARKINVLIASPESQSSEYGETPVAKQGTGTGTYWRPQYATNASTQTVVLGEDWEEFVKGIHLYLAEGVDKTAPAGQYPIMGRYDGSKNYEVDFSGMWEGDIAAQYKDPAFGEINQRAGKYTINRRNIVLNLSTELVSEYGDDLVKFWEYLTGYTFSREGGGNALVDGDSLTLDASLFYLRVSSGKSIKGGSEETKFANYQLHAKSYTLLFDKTGYRSSEAYKTGANANYEIEVENGTYIVEPRSIKIEIGATGGTEFLKATMEYGGEVPARTAHVTRTPDGKVGDGFVGEDGKALDDYLEGTGSIGNYDASLTTSLHLGVGTYSFTADQNLVSSNYNVTWVFGTLTVTARKVTVKLEPQSSVYGEGETVGNTQGENWTAALSSSSTYFGQAGVEAIVGEDNLNITITKAPGVTVGKYDLKATYSNNNYDVTFDGESGGYTIEKRNIIINIDDRSSVYGETLNISDVLGDVWSVVTDAAQYTSSTLTQNWTGNPHYNNDNLGVKLELATIEDNFTDQAKNSVLKVGSYAIIVDGSSLNPNYNFYFEGAWKGADSYARGAHRARVGDARLLSGEYSGHAGIYTVIKRVIVITPNDTSSVYGDKTLDDINTAISAQTAWSATSDYAGNAILTDDLEKLAQCISFSLAGTEGKIRASGHLGAGSYAMVGKFDTEHDPGRICDNYDVKFGGSWAVEDTNEGTAGTYTVNKRDVTVTINHVMTFEYDGEEHNDILAFGTTYVGTKWTLDNVFTCANLVKKAGDDKQDDTLATLNITLIKDSGKDVGHYSVTASYTNDDYNVTFEGASQAVEITQRKIVVHIHDQYAVYGENETVSQEMGTGDGDKAWHATFAEGVDGSVYSSGDAIVKDDNLNLSLTKHFGATVNEVGYAIYGMCMNTNYAVEYEGSFTDEGQYTNGTLFAKHAGTYHIVARKIAVEILEQHNTYGEVPNLSTAQGVAWQLYKGDFTPTYNDNVSGKTHANSIVNNDNLGLTFTTDATATTTVADKRNISVKYNNANYDVTFFYDSKQLSPEGREATANGALITDKRAISIALYGVTVKYGEVPAGAKLYHYADDGQGGHYELLINNAMGTIWTPRSALSGNGGAIVNNDNLVLVVGIWMYKDGAGSPFKAGVYVDDAQYCYVYARLATEADNKATVEDGVNMFGDLGANANYEIMVVGNPEFPNDNRDPKGIYTITSGGTTYTSGAATLTIQKRNLTVTPESTTVEYGTEYVEKSLKWTAGGDGYYKPDQAKFEEKGGVRFKTTPPKSTSGHIKVGTYTLELTPISDTDLPALKNYNITHAEGTYRVTPKSISVKITDGEGQYTGQRPTGLEPMILTAAENSIIEGDVVSVARSVLTNVDGTWNVGKYPIRGTVMGDDSSNYTVTLTGDWKAEDGAGTFAEASDYRNGVYTITPIAITVEFLKQNPVYGSQSATLTTNYSAIRDLGWKVTSGKMVVGETLTFDVEIVGVQYFARYYILANTYNVKLTYTQNKNYTITFKYNNESFGKNDVITPADEILTVEGAFEVQKRAITVRINDKGHIYDGKELGGKEFVASDYTVTGVTNDTGEPVVQYSGSTDNLRITLSKAEGVNAGTYAITGTCGNNNYTVTWEGSWSNQDDNEGKAGTYTISKKAITVQIGDQSGVFAGKSAKDKYTLLEQSGVNWSVVGDALVTADRTDGRFTVKLSIVNLDGGEWHAKTYAITAEVGGTSKDNYEVTFSGSWNGADDNLGRAGTYTIRPLELQITLKAQSSVYDGTEPSIPSVAYNTAWVFTAESLSKLGDLFKDNKLDNTPIDDALTLELSKELGVNVGAYKITLAGWGNGDYVLTANNAENKAYSITPRPVTVTIKGQKGVYGEALTVSQVGDAYTVEDGDANSGLVGSDNLNITIKITDSTDKSASGNYKVGWYGLVVSYSNDNYTVTLKGDNFNLSGMPNYTDNREASIADLTIPNSFYVEKRQILVTVNDQSATYDASTYGNLEALNQDKDTAWLAVSALNAAGDAIITGDTLDITISTVGDCIDAGKYYLKGTLGTLDDSGNYEVEFQGSWADEGEYKSKAGTFTIDPAELTITIAPQTHEYDGTAGTIGSKQGTNAEDGNWYVSSGTIYERDDNKDKNYFATLTLSRADKNVHVGDYALSYAYTGENNNYRITYVMDDAYFRITQRRIAVQINNQEKFYDSQAVVLEQGEGVNWVATLHETSTYKEGDAIVGGDDLQITLQATHIDFNAGKYPIVATCSNGDYEVVVWTGDWKNTSNLDNGFGVEDGTAGTYTVNPRNVTVQIKPQKSTYGDPINVSSAKGVAWEDISESREGYGILSMETLNIAISLVKQAENYNNKNAETGSLNVGTYALHVVYDYNKNYIVTFVAGDTKAPLTLNEGTKYEADAEGLFTVEARQIRITLTQQRHEYDGKDGAEGLDSTAFVLGVATNATTSTALAKGDDWDGVAAIQKGLDLTISRTDSVVNVGKYALKAEITNKNYEISYDNADEAFEIYARKITITIKDQSSVYSGKNNKHTAQQDGEWWQLTGGSFVDGDEAAFQVQLSIVNEGTWEVGRYPITGAVIAGNDHNNYEVVFEGAWEGREHNLTAGVYEITAKDITVTIDDISSVYGEDLKDLTWKITESNLADGDDENELGVILTKATGSDAGKYAITGTASGKNYNVTFTGNWAEGENSGKAGVYEITKRPVNIVILGQSTVYGSIAVNSAVDIGWKVSEENTYKPLASDNLNIELTLIDHDNWSNANRNALNSGWYAVKVTYRNENYVLTFFLNNENLASDTDNITDYAGHAKKDVKITDVEGDLIAEDAFCIYARRLVISIANQEGAYKGKNQAPELRQKSADFVAWTATNILNASRPPFVEGDGEPEITLTFEADALSRNIWNAGEYKITGSVTSIVHSSNYIVESIENGTFTIKPLNVTVTVEAQSYAVYNGNDWANDFLAKTQDVTAFDGNGYWTAVGVLSDDQDSFAKAIQLKLLGVAKDANVYSASGEWRDGADADIKTNYVVTYNGSSVFTVQKRKVNVEIQNASSVYGENEAKLETGTITCTNDKTETHDKGTINSDDLGITLIKTGGTNVGTYAITGSWNNNSNYEVNFTGSWEGEDANKDHAGTYKITPRKLTVHVNDQGGVFGGRTYTNLSQFQGEDENNGGWYIIGFTDKEDISKHNQDTNNYVIFGDNLQIVLTLKKDTSSKDYAGKCAILAECNNKNYEVTFEGSWDNGGDTDGYPENDGKAGTFTVQKRQVTVTLRDQSAIYDGGTHNASDFNRKNSGWTERVTNDHDNDTVTFVTPGIVSGRQTAPEIVITLSMEGAKNVGNYTIHIVIKRDGTTIFDSAETKIDGTTVKLLENGSVVISTNEYEITVIGTIAREKVGEESSDVKVCSNYEITPKAVTLTIDNMISTYGEKTYGETLSELTWKDLAKGIVAADMDAVIAAIKLAIEGTEGKLRGETYLVAGTYEIKATVAPNDTTNNYTFSFVGTTGTIGYGTYTVNKRSIGLRVQDVSVVYGDELTYSYLKINLGTSVDVILGCDQKAFDDVIKYTVLNTAYSRSKNLKAGTYPIWMSLDETKTENYAIVNGNYEITFTGLWSAGGTHDGTQLNSRAGVLTVGKKNIAVTDITSTTNEKRTSEYGDEVPNDWSYVAAEGSVLDGDTVTVMYHTEASVKANVGTYPITVALADAESGDNENYTMTMDHAVNYFIKRRVVTVNIPKEHAIIYGNDREYPEVVVTRANSEGAWDQYADGKTVPNVAVSCSVVGETLSSSGFLRVKMESGAVIGYDVTVSLSGVNASNYLIQNDTTTFEKKLIVNKRPVTVAIDDKASVYGESEQPLTYDVKGLASGDEASILNVTLTRQGLSAGQSNVGSYAITGISNCTDYEVTFSGNWNSDETMSRSYRDHAGIYTITQRAVRIVIYNQSAPYGENITVGSVEGTNWNSLEGAEVDGVKYYSVKLGDSLGISLKLETTAVGHLTRGAYELTLDESSVNSNYKVTVVRADLPEGDEAHTAFAEDFSKSETSIGDMMWGYRTPISTDLRWATHGMFFVTIRDVDVLIGDQSGVYGETFTLPQYEENGAYTISLTTDKGTTGSVFKDGLAVTFDLVTTAYEGATAAGLKNGKLTYAGYYPIFSSGIKATKNGETLANTDQILQNYRFNFKGGWTHDGTYPSGSSYNGRVGVFTVLKRNVTVTVSDVTTTYGTYKDLNADGGELLLANQKGYTAIVNNGTGSAFVTETDEALFKIKLIVNYMANNVSTGKALNAGTYNITASKRETYADNEAFNSYYVTFANTAPKLTVNKANITISILSGKSSVYGDELTVDNVSWNSVENPEMFNATGGGYVEGDVLNFDMHASLIDDVREGKYAKAGNYAIYVETWSFDRGDNANYNTPTWTGSFTGGVRREDAQYANIAGIYTVHKKRIEVTINDAESEYGEEIDSSIFSYTLPKDWSVGTDTESDLHIVLFTDANESSPFSATGYAIKGNSNSDNYEVTFKGSYLDTTSGTLTIDPRRIVVVIRPQSSVYGTNPVASSETTQWFVVRDDAMVDASNMATNWASVFGAAREKSMSELYITLTKGNTYVDGSKWSNGNGLFAGKYAITGRCDNSNFDVVFCAYNSEYDSSVDKYNPTVSGTTEKEIADEWSKLPDNWGVYTIKPLSVTVEIKDRSGVYGSILTDGETQLRYDAKLVNTQNVAWTYGDGSGTFTVGHEVYLDFYLRCATDKGKIFAEVGKHQIEGVWARSIADDDMTLLGIKNNYNVKFVNESGDGERGVFTVTPATIQQNNREAEGGETFTGTLWNQTQLYRGDTVKYSLKVDERFFIFAGGLKFGQDVLNGGTVVYDAATVTYKNLKKDNQVIKEGVVTDKDLEITSYGVWTVDVTIVKQNHTEATFTLSLTVVQADLTVTLRSEARFTTTYGDYLANGQGAKDGAKTFEELKAALKTWLFDINVIEKIDGAENIAAKLDVIIEALRRVEGDDAITVSIIATDENKSTGGYLNAGNYVLTFEVDGNIKIKFAQTYSVVTVEKRELNMQWVPAEGDDVDMEGNVFTYSYDGEDHTLTATPKDLLDGDLVANFGMSRYLVKDGTETLQLDLRFVGEYRVRIVVDNNSAAAGNSDIGNYDVQPVELTVIIKTINITVLINDRTNEYGEQELDPNEEGAWTITKGADALPAGEDLLITLWFDAFQESRDRRPSGTYKIFGRSDNTNYTVTFVGSYGETAEGRNDGKYGTYTVAKRRIDVTVHDITATYGDYTYDDLKNFNFENLRDTAYTISRPNAGYSTMAQTSDVTIFPDDTETLAISIRLDPDSAQYTGTGYLKANKAGYRLICDYYRDFDYELTFRLDSGAQYNGSDRTSKLIVNQKDLSVTIYTRTAVYGDDRPTMPMNYSVSGFAPEDTVWFETNRDTTASFLKFTVRNADTQEALDESKSFDPVGVYIIMLESDTSNSHDIGSNYKITVTGEWTAYGKYSDDKYVGKASKYEVTPRPVTIVIHAASGEYGDSDVAERIAVDVISTQFAPGDTAESIRNMINFDLSNVLDESGRTRAAGASYDVTAQMLSRNYTLDGTLTVKYQMLPREIDLIAFDCSSEYGDRHQDLVAGRGYSIGWTAVRSNGKEGNGIAYQQIDEICVLIKVATDTSSIVDVGTGYRIYIDANTINLDKNYHVNSMTDGTLTIVPRRIRVHVNPQTSEYGEEHVLSDRYELDWTAERFETPPYADENVVVLPNDIYDIVLSFATSIDRTSPADVYEIMAEFRNKNYVVAEVVDGSYTITPRKISVKIENASGEYGDPVSGLSWTASRVGGNAIVNGDVLDITLQAVLTNGRAVDGRIGIGTYPIIVTAQNNPNYAITFTGDYSGTLPDVRVGNAAGNYEVTRRRIVMTFNGESEYGDKIDPFTASYRADGKEGPAIVNGDNFGYSYEWVDNPYPYGEDVPAAVGSYRLRVTRPTEPTAAQANYEVVSDDVNYASVYNVVPRKVTINVMDGGRTYGDAFVDPNTDIMSQLDIRRTTPGKSGDAILGNDIEFFSLKVVDGDIATLNEEGVPYFAGTYNYELSYTLDNPNYELTVIYGNYVVSPKQIEVQIDDKTQNYGEDLLELTHSAIEGVLDGDDLGFTLSVLWGEGQEGLTWHNAGVYRIEASATNPNYALLINGTPDGVGTYTILKVHNSWLKEYSVDRLYQGDEPDPELLPEAEWGDVIIQYYLDEACTQELGRDIQYADMGTYFVKVTVLDTVNWDGLMKVYTVEVFNDFLNIDMMDVTAYVCLFASQFLIGLFALLFVGRKKKQKNQ